MLQLILSLPSPKIIAIPASIACAIAKESQVSRGLPIPNYTAFNYWH